MGRSTLKERSENGQGTRPGLWREWLWPLDWMTLRVSPVYLGIGVPPGDGSAVVVVPGFMGTDAYLTEMFFWLQRIGYRPYLSGIGLNAECPDRLGRRLIETMERAREETGGRVQVVGHSLGGLMGRVACVMRPDLASQVICLGSPLREGNTHPAVMAMVETVRRSIELRRSNEGKGACFSTGCGCRFVSALGAPMPVSVRHAAIYSHDDGVVDWRDSLAAEADLNYDVGGTHLGLVVNPRAYRIIGRLLADCRVEEEWERAA